MRTVTYLDFEGPFSHILQGQCLIGLPFAQVINLVYDSLIPFCDHIDLSITENALKMLFPYAVQTDNSSRDTSVDEYQ